MGSGLKYAAMRYWLAFFVVGVVAGAVACYSPNFGSPGYYCDPDSSPACPSGQECVNGQCVSPGHTNTDGDMAAPSGDMKGVDMKGTDMKGADMKTPDMAPT